MSAPESESLVRPPDRAVRSRDPRLPAAALTALVVLALVPGACNDVTRPASEPADEDPWSLGPGMSLPMAYQEVTDSQCTSMSFCAIEVVDATKYCMCELDHAPTISVEGGAGIPPPPPYIPEPPGHPHTDYWNWPTPPGEGGIEPPPGTGCDIESILDPCPHFTATLRCPLDVTRGDEGECVLHVDPDTALEAIHQWRFDQEPGDLQSVSQHQDTVWGGELVTSGTVTATILGYGREVQVTAPLGVVSRGWTWAGGGDLTYSAGGLSWPPGSTKVGETCRAEPLGCGEWVVQPDSGGFEGGSGYSSKEVDDDGPNDGFVFVQSVTADVALASALRPDLLADGEKRPQGCPPADSLNFIDFNESSCAENDPGWGAVWLNWAWGHEDLHAAKAFDFVDQNAEFDIRYELEGLVAESDEALEDLVLPVAGPSIRCVHLATALHGSSLSSPPHPAPTFDIWFWNGVVYSERLASEGAWWNDATDFGQWLQDWQDCF